MATPISTQEIAARTLIDVSAYLDEHDGATVPEMVEALDASGDSIRTALHTLRTIAIGKRNRARVHYKPAAGVNGLLQRWGRVA